MKCFLAGFGSGFGVAVSLVILLAIIVDAAFIRAGEATISERCLVAGQRWPWIAVLVSLTIVAPFLVLIGHLFFGQSK